MAYQYVGAIDQGTTSTRFLLFDRKGQIVASAQKEHPQIYPKPGWVEHDAMTIWERTCEVIQSALKESSIDPKEIASIGITNQRETTVVWDKKTGKPLYNAIVWQDTRTDAICAEFEKEGGKERFRAKTGLPLATYFSGPKLKWLIDNVSAVKDAVHNKTALFGTIDTWLIWNLTGGCNGGAHITDVTNASRTMLLNIKMLDWDREMLSAMGIPVTMLPQVRPSSDPEIYGLTKKDGPFGMEIKVCGDLGDQQAALFGQACYDVGEAKNTYGTGCFMLLNTGEKPVMSEYGLLTTVAYKIGKKSAHYALEGSIAIAGSLIQWARDNLKMITSAPEIDRLAESVPDNGGVYYVPAFSGLFAPYWRNDARGVIAGLTHYVNKGHIARAILESTAFQALEIFEAMTKDSGIKLKELKVDGGMVVSELLMQFQSDILGVPVVRPQVTETSSLGAAYAAGLAVGFWESEADLRKNWQKNKDWQPQMEPNKRDKLYRFWKKAVERTMNWLD